MVVRLDMSTGCLLKNRRTALGPASLRPLCKASFARFGSLPRRYVDDRLGELIGVARALGMGHGFFACDLAALT